METLSSIRASKCPNEKGQHGLNTYPIYIKQILKQGCFNFHFSNMCVRILWKYIFKAEKKIYLKRKIEWGMAWFGHGHERLLIPGAPAAHRCYTRISKATKAYLAAFLNQLKKHIKLVSKS